MKLDFDPKLIKVRQLSFKKFSIKKIAGMEWNSNVGTKVISKDKNISVKVVIVRLGQFNYFLHLMCGVHSSKYFHVNGEFIYTNLGLYIHAGLSGILKKKKKKITFFFFLDSSNFYGSLCYSPVGSNELNFKEVGDTVLITCSPQNNTITFEGIII